NVEEDILAQQFRSRGVRLADLIDYSLKCGIELSGHVDVLLQVALDRPDVDLFLLDRRVVLAQLILAAVKRLHDRVQMTLGRLISAEVITRAFAQRNQPKEVLRIEQVMSRRIEVFDRTPKLDQRLRNGDALAEGA